MSFDLRVDGGFVVPSDAEPFRASIGIREGRIIAIGDLAGTASAEVLDVGGTYILPGIIDTHVHIGFTSPERELETESRAAAVGGVTTALIYFRSTEPYDSILSNFIAQGRRQSVVDFAVHLGILHDDHLERLDHYIETFGITSLKMYTTYRHDELRLYGVVGQDDGFILDVLRKASSIPGFVVNVHCENDDMAERGKARWINPAAPGVQQWSDARPPVAEVEAIRRLGLLAREAGAQLYLPHVSSERAFLAARAEQWAGARLWIETCPQYLHARAIQNAGYLAKVNPPVRTPADGDALWRALALGQIDTVGTDHAALMRSDKQQADILTARPGFPGIGTLLPLLLDGVHQGHIPLCAVAAAQARAARIFQLRGKGQLLPGFDADLAVVDLRVKRRVIAAETTGISDFTPFEGLELTGWPVITVRRGEVVARGGQVVADMAGTGRYVRNAVPAGALGHVACSD